MVRGMVTSMCLPSLGEVILCLIVFEVGAQAVIKLNKSCIFPLG